METITNKTIKVFSGSSIILSALAILIAIGILYVVALVFGIDKTIDLTGFMMIILGIAAYYFAFSSLCWLFLRKISNKTAAV